MIERDGIVVIGGANADVKSRTDAALVAGTSNPGRTTVAAGGVGRNIAASLAQLGMPVALVSVVGTDALGDLVLTETERAGVDVRAVARFAEHATGIYNAILDADGELVAGVASMHALRALTPDVLVTHDARIAGARWVVLDANLSPETIGAALDLAARSGTRAALEPVSVPKARLLRDALRADRPVALLTPNREELAAMVGVGALDDASLHDACRSLHRDGVALVWVRLGAHGSLLSAAGSDEAVRVPTIPVTDVADVTGAGDAALAAYLWADSHDHDMRTCARFGTAAALLTLRSRSTVTDQLDAATLRAVFDTLPETP